jgi:nitrogen fixation-related uncharacterized protein
MLNLIPSLLVVLLNIHFLVQSADFNESGLLTNENDIQANDGQLFASPSNKYTGTSLTESLPLKGPPKISHPSISLQSVSPNLFMQLVAGKSTQGYNGDGGPATSAQIFCGIPWVDSIGNVYITDDNHLRIRRVDTNGMINTVGGTGSQSQAGVGGSATSVSFYSPWSIVGDLAGTVLYISDAHYIWTYVLSSNTISVFAGTTSQGYSGDNSPASSAQLNWPVGLWLTTAGDLYIADFYNNRVRKISTGIIVTIAGNGPSGSHGSFAGDNGPSTSASLNYPYGTYVDTTGRLFIADKDNNRIRSVDANHFITTFAGTGNGSFFNGENIPATSANINTPIDVKGDSLGNIYIADRGNCIIRRVDISGIISTLFGTLSSCGFSPGISSRTSSINGPLGIWLDSLSNIYFSDYNSIHRSLVVSLPTSQPSDQPSSQPTSQPTRRPTSQPSSQPTKLTLTTEDSVFAVYSGRITDASNTLSANSLYAQSISVNADGSYNIGGYLTVDRGGWVGAPFGFLGRIKTNGQKKWFYESVGRVAQILSSIIMDNTVYAAGRLYPGGYYGFYPYISKNSLVDGTLLSAWTLSGFNNVYQGGDAVVQTILPTSRRTLLCFGYDNGGSNFVVEFDPGQGTVLSSQLIRPSHSGKLQTAIETSDGSYLIVGNNITTTSANGWLSKMRYNGTAWKSIWTRHYLSPGVYSHTLIKGIAEKNNSVIFAGSNNGYGIIGSLNGSTGITNWIISIGPLVGGMLNGIAFGKGSLDQIMVVGTSYSGVLGGNSAAWNVLVNLNNGMLRKSVKLGGAGGESAQSVVINRDGTFSFIGTTGSYGTSSPNLLFVILTKNFEVDSSILPSAIVSQDNTADMVVGSQVTLSLLSSISFSPHSSSASNTASVLSRANDTIQAVWQAVATPTPTSQPSEQPTQQPSSSPTSHRTDMSCETFRSINGWTKSNRIACNVNTASGYYWKVTLKVDEYGLWGFCSSGNYPVCNSSTVGLLGQTYAWKDWDVPWFEISTNWCRRSEPNGTVCGCPADGPISYCPSDDITIFCGRYRAVCTAIPASAVIPSSQPSSQPISRPSRQPSIQPTSKPTRQPTSQPSFQPTCQPTSFISGTLKKGLVAYYPFDGSARDQSGNGNNGEVHNVVLTSDRFGNANSAYSFDGSSSYVKISNGHSFDFANNFSVAFWVNPAANQTAWAKIFSKTALANSESSWVIQQDGFILNHFQPAYRQFVSDSWFKSSNTGLAASQWNHYSITKENTKLNSYLNGNLVSTSFGTYPSIKTNGNLPLFIGAVDATNGYYLKGVLDDIVIFNRTLTANEVLKLYQFEAPSSQPTEHPSSKPSRFPSVHPSTYPKFVGHSLSLSSLTSAQGVNFRDSRNSFPNNFKNHFGYSVSAAGDVNKDGIDDFLVGTFSANSQNGGAYGGVYLIYGNRNLPLVPRDLANATVWQYVLFTGNYYDYLGGAGNKAISAAGDVNGDGYDDMLIAAMGYPGSLQSGEAFIVFGSDRLTNLVLDSLTSQQGIIIRGSSIVFNFATSSSGIRDFNGDGLDDVAISSPDYPNPGKYGLISIIYGSHSLSNIPLVTALTPQQGLLIVGSNAGSYFGRFITGIGDFNGDGKPDLLASTSTYFDGTRVVVCSGYYIIFGGNYTTPGTNSVNITQLVKSQSAIVLYEPSMAAFTADKIDINNDQLMDVIIGFLPSKRACVIYGNRNRININIGTLNQNQGFCIIGSTSNSYMTQVVGLGDFNSDGFNDIAVSDYLYSGSNGIVYVIYGGTNLTSIHLTSGISHSRGFMIIGYGGGSSGKDLGTADVNHDGRPDLIIGAPFITQGSAIGKAFVVFGGESFPTSQPTTQPIIQPTIQPSVQPSQQPSSRPSTQPTERPTLQPFTIPSRRPTLQPSGIPSEQPRSLPTNIPSIQPTVKPSCVPTVQPTEKPSLTPSTQPNKPTSLPTEINSIQPSERPTLTPSTRPISQPSLHPSALPSGQPSTLPTSTPTSPPTSQPTLQPTGIPSVLPSSCPSSQPTCVPTMQPSSIPTQQPFTCPSSQPTSLPSYYPTCTPTLDPTETPTNCPSAKPSSVPSLKPSTKPSCTPFSVPSIQPMSRPSSQPSCYPTKFPTAKPSLQPTSQPTVQPSRQPTSKPSKQPRSHPSSPPTSSPITSSPTSIPTIITESPTPLRVPSISSYPSQTRKPTRQPFTPKPTAIPTVRPSFIPTSAPTQTISVFPAGTINFKESLFFLGSYFPAVESIPNIYLTQDPIGSIFIIFGFQRKDRTATEIIIGSRNSQGLYSHIVHEAVLMQDTMSRSVVPMGDFNGDTYEDLLICDPINSCCFLYFGHVNGFQNLRVSFAIKSNNNDLFGWSIAKLNDVNKDNYADIAISALSSNVIYVFFGSKNNDDINIDKLDPTIGIKIIGCQNDQNTGLALSSAGDFNNDGYSDILFSAIQASPYQNVIYIVFLNAKMMKQNIIIDNLTPNKDYFKIIVPLFSFAGFSLSNLGDVNQDGFDDIIIGSIPYSGKYLTQKSYVIYGRNSSNTLSLSEITEEDGFTITGGGFMVGGPGDVNGDGIPDIMICSYQQWQGKGNSYIMVYPRNVTNPPTFHPSSQPSSVPSSFPTAFPSLIVREPTSIPTFEETMNEPVNEETFAPFLETTQLPSLAPKTSKPTRSPSIKSTTHSPTVKTNPPSLLPTINPTIRPSTSPNTKRPSKPPAGRPITSHFTTSFPSLIVSESLATPFEEITIDRAGVYNGPSGKVNYIISGEGSFEIISYGGGIKIYTILPSKNNIIITGLNKRYDQINLIHFPYLYSINDLVYRTSPLQIFLSNEQKLILPSMDASELTESNFVFHRDNTDENMNSVQLNLSSMISLGILVSCVGLIGFLVKMNQMEDDDTYPWKNILQDTDAVIVVETNNENVVQAESQYEILPSAFSSNLTSSSENDSESDDSDSDNSSEEEGKLSENDWNLFSSLQSFFSSDNDSVESLEENIESVLNVFSVVDPEVEEDELSFVFTESDDEQETGGNIDIERNYNDNDGDDISFTQSSNNKPQQ